jgi:hypothetical protein
MTDSVDRLARQSPSTVLALVELTGHDAPVVEATRALAGASHSTVILLRVARPVSESPRQRGWRRHRAAVDAAGHQALRRLASLFLRQNLHVQTSVRFGETVEQVVKAAIAAGATAVVAASRPARWLWWRNRDRRLRRSLDIPVMLVSTGTVKDHGFVSKRDDRIQPSDAGRGRREESRMRRRAAVIGLIVACALVAAIAGYGRVGPSVERQTQARAVPAPAALPDFSALVAAYGSAVVNIAAAQMVRASNPASGRGVIVLAEGSGFIVRIRQDRHRHRLDGRHRVRYRQGPGRVRRDRRPNRPNKIRRR